MTWAIIGAAVVGAVAADVSEGDAAAGGTTAAPPFSDGGGGGVGPLGLNEEVPQSGNIGRLFGKNSIESLIGKPEERGQELPQSAVTPQAQDVAGPPQAPPLGPAEGTPEFVGPSATPSGASDELGIFGKFFGNLDQNLESPAKLLGLGLLSQIDPRLAQAGLFAGGLFGNNKF